MAGQTFSLRALEPMVTLEMIVIYDDCHFVAIVFMRQTMRFALPFTQVSVFFTH